MNSLLMLALSAGVPEGRVFALDSQTFIQICAHIINVSLLAVILSRLLYKPVRNFLKSRSDRIKGQLDSAGEDMAKANELKLDYERKIKSIDKERDEILEGARKEAVEMSRKIIAEAKQEADSIKERAKANVEMEWLNAQDQMKREIIQVSAAMAGKFLTLAINKETHDKLFNEAIAELEGMSWRS